MEKTDAFSKILRMITPMLIGIIGYISIQYLSSIDNRFLNIDNKIDYKFDAFLSAGHIIEKRVDRLEYKVFGEK